MNKRFYTYNWFEFNLNVDCTKCGNNIVFQDFDGNPTCNECGNVSKYPWTDVLKEVEVSRATRDGGSNLKLMGTFNATANSGPVDKVNCYHCKSQLSITDETDLKNYHCASCNQPITFKEYAEFPEIVFYRYGTTMENNNEGIKPIAVRCVSCGAPLTVDPTKNNFTCGHCSTDNILPMSMRYKVVLADIFLAERKARHPKLLAFEKDGKLVKQSLRENGKESFADAELDKVLLNKKDDVGIWHIIIDEYKYLPPDKVLLELFNTSNNQTVIDLVGKRLQKSKEEVANRIQEVNPKFKQNKQSFEKAQQKKEVKRKATKLFSTQNFIYLIIGLVLVFVFYTVWKSLT